MSDYIAENIRSLRGFVGLNQAELAEHTGISQSAISAWECKGSIPRKNNIQKIIDAFPDLNLQTCDILGDRDGFSRRAMVNDGMFTSNTERTAPVYGSIAAGQPLEMIPDKIRFTIPDHLADRYPEAFYLKARGESMNRRIPNGSYVLINPSAEIIDGKVYAVSIEGQDATLKRVRMTNGRVELQPDSFDETFKPIVFNDPIAQHNSIKVIGQAVWLTTPFDYEL